MKNSLVAAIMLILGSPLFMQGADDSPLADSRKVMFGGRINVYPFQLFTASTKETSTVKPVADYSYTGSSNSSRFAVGPTFDYKLNGRITIGTEFHIHRVQYKQVTEIRSGKRDPNASSDDRKKTTITETTRPDYWEVPVIVRYFGLRPNGIYSRLYSLGGVQFRHVGTVRTGNEYSYADGTTDYNEIPSKPAQRNQAGFVVGVGFRYADDFNIKFMPEIRFTRWIGSAFEGPAFRSRGNQIEASIGFCF